MLFHHLFILPPHYGDTIRDSAQQWTQCVPVQVWPQLVKISLDLFVIGVSLLCASVYFNSECDGDIFEWCVLIVTVGMEEHSSSGWEILDVVEQSSFVAASEAGTQHVV